MAKTRKHDRERGPGSHDDRDLSLQAELSTRRGPLTLTSTMVRARLSRALDEAARGRDVVITRRGVPQGVLVAAGRYSELLARESSDHNAGRALADSEYALMQTPLVRAGTRVGLTPPPLKWGGPRYERRGVSVTRAITTRPDQAVTTTSGAGHLPVWRSA